MNVRALIFDKLDAAGMPLLNLIHNRKRSAIAGAGVAFSIMFMLLQLGFYGTVEYTAVALIDLLDGDLVLMSPRYFHFMFPDDIDRGRIMQAYADPAVESAVPLYITAGTWRSVDTRARATVIAMGLDLDDRPALDLPALRTHRDQLRETRAILVDTVSQPKLGAIEVGIRPELGQDRVSIVGQVAIGAGFVCDGLVITSAESFFRLFPIEDRRRAHLGVVKLKDGSSVGDAQARLRALMPEDTRVLTKKELRDLQKRFWIDNTSFGSIFSTGALLGFLVGLVVLNQVLSTDIGNHLPQYATLKAMGYDAKMLDRFVVVQALGFAVGGYVPGVMVSLGAYGLVRTATHMPMYMTVGRLLFVLVLTVMMSVGSARFAARRLSRADPVELC